MLKKLAIVLSDHEKSILKKLSTPVKIQDFLNSLTANFETSGDVLISPRRVLRENKAHCVEGALLAALALWYHGQPPLLMDLVTTEGDFDHVVALFKKDGHWGAVSKTNHAVLRYREPVYLSPRELAMSYFHEYFMDDGRKTMRSFSKPFDLSKIKDQSWITSENDIWFIADALDSSPHEKILNRSTLASLRKADPIEREAGKIVEWPRKS